MAEFVQENVVQHEPANGDFWPLPPAFRSKFAGGLSAGSGVPCRTCKAAVQAYSRWQRTDRDFAMPHIDVAQCANSRAAVIEMNPAQTCPAIFRHTRQQHLDVVLVDIVPAFAACTRCTEVDASHVRPPKIESFAMNDSMLTPRRREHATRYFASSAFQYTSLMNFVQLSSRTWWSA